MINGRKWFTSCVDGAAFCIVMAVTNPDEESRHKRASMIIVPTNTPGLEIVRNIPIMGDLGKGFFSHGEVQYTNVRVPKKNIIQTSFKRHSNIIQIYFLLYDHSNIIHMLY